MIKITFIGKTKDRFSQEKIQDYLQRLQKYQRVEIQETEKLPQEGLIILLEERGKEFTSLEFANYLQKKIMNEKNTTFVCGPAKGFPADYLKQHSEKLALSKFTLQHELARVLFLEQLYRAFTILKKEPYHK